MKKLEKLRINSPKIIEKGLSKKQLSDMDLVHLVGGYDTCPGDYCNAGDCSVDCRTNWGCGRDYCGDAGCVVDCDDIR